MADLERYLAAADRQNTTKSYVQGTRHFEEAFGGLLPASGESVARYLAAYAGTLSINTLRQRLSALARWHTLHGFVDPTRDPLVRQAFRGIRAVHPAKEKQATPLQLADLERVSSHYTGLALMARRAGDRAAELQALRDRALVLLGFWRAFRSDELVNLSVEHMSLQPGKELSIFIPRSKTDRQNEGRTLQVPALSRLCPVEAVDAWVRAAKLTAGPLFRRITRWGTLGQAPLNSNSIIRLLRRIFADAGVQGTHDYSSHSLRRGLAGWATANGWDLKTLMQYVGWRDVKSAARYIDAAIDDRGRIETGLARSMPAPVAEAPAPTHVSLIVSVKMASYSGKTRGIVPSRRHMEEICLARFGGQKYGRDGQRYRIQMPREDAEGSLTERISDLLDEMHQVASHNDCYLEVSVKDLDSGRTWD